MSWRCRAFRSLFLVATLLALAPPVAARDLVICDTDALPSGPYYGAIFGVDLAAAPDSLLEEMASASGGSTFEYIWEVAVSPLDDSIYVVDFGTTRPPRIVQLCPGAFRVVTEDPRFGVPINVEVLANGTLLVADGDADPAGLGNDPAGGPGHGAIFLVDPVTGTVTVVSDGTSHDVLPGAGASAFVDPYGVAYDPSANLVYVADSQADPLAVGAVGAVFAVRPADGHVSLVASGGAITFPVAVSVRADGRPVVLDFNGSGAGIGGGMAWDIDLAGLDPTTRESPLCGGPQMSVVSDIAIAADGSVYIVDLGDYDPMTGTFISPPALWRVDETNANPFANAQLVHSSVDMVTPFSVAARGGCTPAPPASESLGINRGGARTIAEVRTQVDPGCRTARFVLCAEQIVDQRLDGLTLLGEATAAGVESVWLYEHTDAIGTMRVRRAGSDLVFSSR